MVKIKSVSARQILDSRGKPTIEVSLSSSNFKEVASVPSGASTGIHEALELRDNDPKYYAGLGVNQAVSNVQKEIAEKIIDKEFDQKTLDQFLIDLDGTPNKSKLGANAILGVSMAFAKVEAKEEGLELYEYLAKLAENKNYKFPVPMLNIINGGQHADSGLDIQEFMLGPVGFDSFKEKIRVGAEVIYALRKILKDKGYTVSVGDEGGFAPKLETNEEALELMVMAIEKAGYTRDQVKIGMDAAASSFYENGKYKLKINGELKSLSSEEMVAWYKDLTEKYPIISIEDGLAEDDWEGFNLLTKTLGSKITIVGDDLLVTNIKRIKTAIEKEAVNSVLIKLNQIGTVTETIEAITLAQKQGWSPFVSHRSGETTDTFIADLSVGLACPFIKSGSLVRGERVCKYNRIMEIEDNLL
ncbi:MAG TPA: phosphopyruvate hydratase [Candidatus Paceibacterota bacterium]|nr:phosphopyruvate hydratase [Candidatus Paceibacterota bacterium]HQO70733.1 phosphopyruvate hydratase [Candidatus Paceibacterota bacterium]